jgi:hypothetical protein
MIELHPDAGYRFVAGRSPTAARASAVLLSRGTPNC